MSDESRGPGWWLASDGKWYPPQTHPNPPSSSVMPPPSAWTQPVAVPTQAPLGRAPISAKEANADAKAAKARAKALRPWYRKKRFLFAVAILAIVVIIVAAASNSSKKTTTSGSTIPGVDKGVGARDASGDIGNVTLGAPDSLGFRAVTLTVTNHSSKRSNYLIEMSIESPDGKTQYDTSFATVSNLEPGQSTTPNAFPVTKKVPDDAVVKLKSVQRLAA